MLEEKKIEWSQQQRDFIDWAVKGHGSCCLIAVAGAGKSTTVVEAAIRMPGQTAMMAYNKSAGKELKEKLEAKGATWQKVQAGTAHSFGFAAYRKAFPNVRVDGEKVSKMIDDSIERSETDIMKEKLTKYQSKLRMLVSYAKQQALGVLGSIEDNKLWFDIIDHFDMLDEESAVDPEWLIDTARQFLMASNRDTRVIDFDDMIYLPLLKRLRFWRYNNVIMDEAQDTNPARRALIRAMLKPGGRMIAVGDPCQAIYGFTGADANSIELIKQDFSAKEMPLTVSYRCPKAVVAFSQAWVSHIESHPEAPAGRVSQCNEEEFFKILTANDTNLGEALSKAHQSQSAVLCRLTKPLVQTAFSLIRRKIACKVEGRDIGEQIKKLATRWKVQNTEALENRLNDYLDREVTKLLAKKQETKAALVEDMVQTLKVIIDQCNLEKKYRVEDVIAYIDDLFQDDVKGVLTLSTIHKAKGREWDSVYWLNRASTCPSPWARQEWQQEQEKNLCYVAATRAKSELIELTIAFEKKAKQSKDEKQSKEENK